MQRRQIPTGGRSWPLGVNFEEQLGYGIGARRSVL